MRLQIAIVRGGANQRERTVELAQRTRKTGHVTPVAIQRVEIYKVGKQQPTLRLLEPRENCLDALLVVRSVTRAQRVAGKEVVHLAHAGARDPRAGKRVEQGFARRRERVVPPVFRALVLPFASDERARDDATQVVRLHELLTRGRTGSV